MERERRRFPKKTAAAVMLAGSLSTTVYASYDFVTRNNALDRQLAAQGVEKPSDREFDRAYEKENKCSSKSSTSPDCASAEKTIADYRAYKGRFTKTDGADIVFGAVSLLGAVASGVILFRREQKAPAPQVKDLPEVPPPQQTPEPQQLTTAQILAIRIATRHLNKGP